MKKQREVTKDRIGKIMKTRQPGTMTALAHHLGYKGSPSGSLTVKIRKLVPGIDKLLKMNKAAEEIAKPKPKRKPAGKQKKTFNRPEISPFRANTLYGAIFDCLYSNRKNGIERNKILEHLRKHPDPAIASKSEQCHRWALVVVSSSRETGEAHKSISGKHADIYWVEKLGMRGERLKFHLRTQQYTAN